MNRREWMVTALSATLGGCRSSASGLEFTGSNEIALNPERGFYIQRAIEEGANFQDIRKAGSSIVLVTMDLVKFKERPLVDAKLERLDVALKAVRDAGLKAIFRAAYGFTDNDYRADPLDLGLIQRHISRMAEVLSRHTPVVWAVQAGMLGPWGEWHGSNHGDPPSLEARRAVAGAWLKSLPEEIFLQIRRPMFHRDMFVSPNDPGAARTGCHNDAMLALPDDMGTYNEPGWNRTQEVKWVGEQSRKTPFGGETVPGSKGTPVEQVLREFKQLRISYLNRGYHPGTPDGWRNAEIGRQNVFAEVESKLGYRWLLRRMRLPENGNRAVFEFENEGYAPVYSTRILEAAWLNRITLEPISETVSTGENFKGWGQDSGIKKITVELPPAPAGAILGLRLPDPAATLRGDGRYAIRLMNEGIRFDERTGWNFQI